MLFDDITMLRAYLAGCAASNAELMKGIKPEKSGAVAIAVADSIIASLGFSEKNDEDHVSMPDVQESTGDLDTCASIRKPTLIGVMAPVKLAVHDTRVSSQVHSSAQVESSSCVTKERSRDNLVPTLGMAEYSLSAKDIIQ